MYSSGTTAKATSGAGAVSLITLPTGASINRLVIVNTGTTDGFFSLDGGTTWGYIPAGTGTIPGAVEWIGKASTSPQFKRNSADMSGVFAFADWFD
jgi:hypothetical protein